LDGDGLDDYIYINEKGATVWWKHLGTDPPSWGLPHLVANPREPVSPRDIQFADTNGDGRLDFNVIGRVTGKTRTWHHLGFQDDMSIRWNTPLPFADRSAPGFTVRLAEASQRHYTIPSANSFALTLRGIL